MDETTLRVGEGVEGAAGGAAVWHWEVGVCVLLGGAADGVFECVVVVGWGGGAGEFVGAGVEGLSGAGAGYEGGCGGCCYGGGLDIGEDGGREGVKWKDGGKEDLPWG